MAHSLKMVCVHSSHSFLSLRFFYYLAIHSFCCPTEIAVLSGTVFSSCWFSSVWHNAERPSNTPRIWKDTARGFGRGFARAEIHQRCARVLRLGTILERAHVRYADGRILND